MTTTEEVQQTLAEYERLAIKTGAEVRIDPPEFWSGLSIHEWSPVWSGEEPPKYARATVYRDGIPTTVYVAWDEALPADDEWRERWLRAPMALFGSFTLRAALRRAFRDAIGDRREADDPADAPVAADRDWSAELAMANTPEAVEKLWDDAKRARAVTVELEQLFRRQLGFLRRSPFAAGGTVKPASVALVGESGPDQIIPLPRAAVMPRPVPSMPTLRPEDTVRKPRKGERRPQRQKPRGPRA